jgi:two-component system LytT family response regulator
MSMNAILIDDEINNIENLRQLLKIHCPDITVTGTATHVDNALVLLQQLQPAIVFLDIQMPDKNGFELLKYFPEPNFEVIFVTAHDQYAIQAMRFSAIDYLLKPINALELQQATQRAIAKHQQKTQNKELKNLLSLLTTQSSKDEQRIALNTLRETRFVKTGEIIRCQSSNNYTTFFLKDEELVVSKPIYEYEEILKDYGFIRCHQSHLVNIRYIKSWKKEYGDFLLLYDGTELPISRGKKDIVREVLNTT